MQAERHRIASLYRSEGEEEALKIRSEADRQVKVLLAESYRESQVIRGNAEAKAISVYANAFNRDPDFYEFARTLEMYKKSLDDQTTLVLPTNSSLLKFLK
jgi:membrane protease subunit HflC